LRFDKGPYLCVGADPHPEILSSWGLEVSIKGLSEFNRLFIESIPEGLEIVKPQVSLYESFGSKGMAELESLLSRLGELGIYSIADAKRSDIGSSMKGYASGWLAKDAPFLASALTVSPYLGVGALGETIEMAARNQKRVFVLVATSNPEAVELQQGGVSKSILEELAAFDRDAVGVVIGATVDTATYGLDQLLTDTQFTILAPGFGAQGAELSDASRLFAFHSQNLIANVSRSVLAGSPQGLKGRIEAAMKELR